MGADLLGTLQGLVLIAAILIAVLIVWHLAGVLGLLLHSGLGALIPEGPGDLWRRTYPALPSPRRALDRYREGIARAIEALKLGSARIVLERAHLKLLKILRSHREEVAKQLRQLGGLTTTGRNASLVELLQGFSADVDKLSKFPEIEDGFADREKERSRLKATYWGSLFGTVVITAFNFGLLYLFFYEVGLPNVPGTQISLAIVLSLALPIFEFLSGYLTNLSKEAPATRLTIQLFVAVALSALEALIFYLLFQSIFEGLGETNAATKVGGIGHYAVTLVGPALVLMGSVCGAAVARSQQELRSLGAERAIRDQVRDAQRFVGDLPHRIGDIDAAAANAGTSIGSLVAQMQGQGEALQPVATVLEEKRVAFLAAVDSVNPNRFQREIEGTNADRMDGARFAWLIAPLAVAGALIFAAALGAQIGRLNILPDDLAAAPYLVAILIAAVVGLMGAFAFERLTITSQTAGEWKDTLWARGNAFRICAVLTLCLLVVGIFGLAINLDGWLVGSIEAVILTTLIAGLAVAGAFHDLVARGTSFWAKVVALLSVFLVEVAVTGALLLLAGAAVVMVSLLFYGSFLLAWPTIWWRSYLARRAVRSSETHEAAPIPNPAAQLQGA